MRKSLIVATAAAIIALPSFSFAQEFVTAPVESAVIIAGDAIAAPGVLITGRSSAYDYYAGASKPNSLEMHPSGPNAQDVGY